MFSAFVFSEMYRHFDRERVFGTCGRTEGHIQLFSIVIQAKL
jgi:hypothetical protein